jgi:SAM dependent carboxyl methyltransferase
MVRPMEGGGSYDRHSDYQMRGGLLHADLVAAAARTIVPDKARGSVVLVDYGCAQGRVSNPLIRLAIEQLRSSHRNVPVQVYHNDRLTNDWAALFERLRSEDSYLHVDGGPVTPLAAATSFYEPVTPRGIVDLGLSFAAIQWLSAPGPRGCGGALYFDQLERKPRAEMADQAHADWTRFLEQRARELAPGGQLVLDMMGVPDGGVAAGHQTWQLVRDVCEDMVRGDRLDATRLDNYVFPVYERSVDEARRPFREALGSRLHLDHLELVPVPNPFTQQYQEDADAAALAKDFAGFFRAFSEPTLREGLGLDENAVEELYRQLASRIEAIAAEFVFDVHAITMVIRRVD